MLTHPLHPMFAYVTFLASENFLPGVIALNKSLRIHNPDYDFVVLTARTVNNDACNLLISIGCKIKMVDQIKNPAIFDEDPRGFGCMYTKLRVFELADYKKVIYLDADLIICKNIESLFQRPHMSAVNAGGLIAENKSWTELNAGLMVIEPSVQLFEKLCSLIDTTISKDGSDQGFLQNVYQSWPEDQNLHLPHKFNIPSVFIEKYCQQHRYEFSYVRRILTTDIAVIHYWGPVKPWHCDIRGFSRRTAAKDIQSLILWWDIFHTAMQDI